MGDLRKKMPITFWTFLVGALALSGVCAVERFYSARTASSRKPSNSIIICCLRDRCFYRRTDDVLHVPAVLRRFLRQGKIRNRLARARIAAVMTLPLIVLAVFSVIGGVIGIQGIYRRACLPPEQETSAGFAQHFDRTVRAIAAGRVACGILAVIVGFFGAFALYAKADNGPAAGKTRRIGDGDEKQVLLRRTLRSHVHPRCMILSRRLPIGLTAGSSKAFASGWFAAARILPAARCACANRQPPDLRLPVCARRGGGALFRFGKMIINDNKRIEVSGAWSALTLALSPRRGRIVVNRLARRAPLEISGSDLCCSLSLGERVRVRASVPSYFKFQLSESGFCK